MNLFRFALLAFVLAFLVQWRSAQMGNFDRSKRGPVQDRDRSDFGTVEAATLTLLGLIIGFSFSMAISRYDQRKNYEEAEANAISTEYLRADVLPEGDAALVRELLQKYIDLRVQSYTVRDTVQLSKIDTNTAEVQNELCPPCDMGPYTRRCLGGVRHGLPPVLHEEWPFCSRFNWRNCPSCLCCQHLQGQLQLSQNRDYTH
jgi:hypothetical protein